MDLNEEYQALLASIGDAQQDIANGQQLLRLLLKFQAQARQATHTIAAAPENTNIWALEAPGQRAPMPLSRVLTIGRQEGCDLRLEDRKVSRQHARIEQRAGGCWVVDLGSSNGVFLNERRINSEARLSDGDQLQIGDTCVIVHEQGIGVSSDRTVVTSSAARPASPHSGSGAVPTEARAQSSLRKCDQCGQLLSSAARFCPDCGTLASSDPQ